MASGYSNYNNALLSESVAYTKTIWGKGTENVVSPSGGTRLVGSNKGNFLQGSSGSDTFDVIHVNDRVAGGGGVDTVWASVNFELPGDVENLTMNGKWGPVFGIANDKANIIKSETANVTIDARGGDDVIISAGNHNTFIFDRGSGEDILMNFKAGDTNSDIVRLVDYGFTSLSQVKAAMIQTGSDVTLKLSDTDLIQFKGSQISDFTSSNFQLSIDPSKLKQTFSDEFNSLSLQNKSAGGGTWATSYAWDKYTSHAAHNIPGESQVYVDPLFAGTGKTALGLNPFSVSDGVLKITPQSTPDAMKASLWDSDYTSGLITTKGSFSQLYGYFEMRVDLPEAKGVFPAFWLLPADNSFGVEIDIMEFVNQTNTVHNTVHFSPKAGEDWSAEGFQNFVTDLANGFHTFGLLWTKETLTWYVDGVAVASTDTPALANKPMYMLANYAVGGDWAGDPTSDNLPSMAIDYIRAYSLEDAPVGSKPPTSGPSAPSTGDDSVSTPTTPATPTEPSTTPTSGADLLVGGKSLAVLAGGAGDDTYQLNGYGNVVVELAGGGVDTVVTGSTYALGANLENLTLTGAGRASGFGNDLANVIIGNKAANTLEGRGGDDKINGGAGNDTITGGRGSDTLIGGEGGDTFVFAKGDGKDIITDFSAGDLLNIKALLDAGQKPTIKISGSDTLISFASGDSILLAGIHPQELAINAKGYSYAGSKTAQTPSEAADSPVQSKPAGTDADVDAPTPSDTDVAAPVGGSGNNSPVSEPVRSSVSHTLDAEHQSLVLTGVAAIDGVGNALDNVITGNIANNRLDGGDGADTLNGGGGHDTLIGGAGNDTYILGADAVTLIEYGGAGVDTVVTGVTYALGANLENLTLTGAGRASGFGNDLANVIIGNKAANTLEGRGGDDKINGGAGNDSITGGHGADTLTGGEGADTFVFAKGDGEDVIVDLGLGADTLNIKGMLDAGYKPTLHGLGSDTLVEFSTGDSMLLLGVQPKELVTTSVGYMHI